MDVNFEMLTWTGLQTHMWHNFHSLSRPFLFLHFFTRPPIFLPVHIRFYPSKWWVDGSLHKVMFPLLAHFLSCDLFPLQLQPSILGKYASKVARHRQVTTTTCVASHCHPRRCRRQRQALPRRVAATLTRYVVQSGAGGVGRCAPLVRARSPVPTTCSTSCPMRSCWRYSCTCSSLTSSMWCRCASDSAKSPMTWSCGESEH